MLTNTYATNFTFKKYTKTLLALSYVNFSEIECQFNLLNSSSEFPVSITLLFNYFYVFISLLRRAFHHNYGIE
jgi:hypothetical protein